MAERRDFMCNYCFGEGTREVPGRGIIDCPECNGAGRIPDNIYNEFGIDLEPNVVILINELTRPSAYLRWLA